MKCLAIGSKVYWHTWFGFAWLGLVCLGLAWLGLAWLGLVRLCLAWFGLVWVGFAWLGLVWLGLVWLGLAWLGFGSSWFNIILGPSKDQLLTKHRTFLKFLGTCLETCLVSLGTNFGMFPIYLRQISKNVRTRHF